MTASETPLPRRITLKSKAETSYTEKRSEFIGFASPCRNEGEALDMIRAIRKQHSTARHHVYAYTFSENHITRYSDDGEPQGTGGLPVLDVIQKQKITDACVVVTRYFGGILLGTGGLTRAYAHAASLAVSAAGIAIYEDFRVYRILCDYAAYQKLLSSLRTFGAMVDASDFSADVSLQIAVPFRQSEAFEKAVGDLTCGNALLSPEGRRYASVDPRHIGE